MNIRLLIHDSAACTQDTGTELALRGEPEGTAVMAITQTAGRGRSGRTWVSPPGKGLALSLILRPRLPAQEVPLLGMLASVAVAEVVEAKGVRQVELKWPNDVLVTGRKIAGILSEARMSGRVAEFVIIGLGLNVNSELLDFPAEFRDHVTSLFLCTGLHWDLEQEARSFLERAAALYERVEQEGARFIPRLWMARWAHRGRIMKRDGITGTGESIDDDGALLLRTPDGTLQRIHSGEAEPVKQP